MSDEKKETCGGEKSVKEPKEGTFFEGKERRAAPPFFEEITGSSFDRRSLVLRLGGAAAAAILPASSEAEEGPSPLSKESPGAPVSALIEEALAVSPAPLSPEQRLDVRNAVRSLQQALSDARKRELAYDVEPAFVFLPEGHR